MRKASNTLKRIVALVAAFAMALALVPLQAFAATGTNHTITVTSQDNASHTYGAYQLFAGDYADGKLSNVDWGKNFDTTKAATFIDALKADNTLKGNTKIAALVGTPGEGQTTSSAADVADALSSITNDSAAAQAFAKVVDGYLTGTPTTATTNNKVASITGLDDGYYLVKDTAEVDASKGTVTRLMLEVVGDVTVNAKNSDVPTVEKKVKDVNDSKATSTADPKNPTDWQDSADYDIGDSVPFQLTGTVPAGAANFNTYKYVFHDVMSAGLTFNSSTVKVYSANTDGSDKTEISTGYELVTTGLTDGCTFEVRFADAKAYAGKTIIVEYSATLNENAVIGAVGNPNKVQLEYSNNPNNEGTGKTEWDHTIVFTYKTVVNKVDQGKKSLAGAAFTLYKKYDASATLPKNADGTPVSTVTMKDKDGNDATYVAVKSYTAGTETSFEFKGLDDGEYKLVETTTPAGYNSIDPIDFTITAEHTTVFTGLDWATGKSGDNQVLTTVDFGTLQHSKNDTTGTATVDVENKSGSTLPSTGGMGVLPFVLVGCGIAVAAGIGLHVARSRREDA